MEWMMHVLSRPYSWAGWWICVNVLHWTYLELHADVLQRAGWMSNWHCLAHLLFLLIMRYIIKCSFWMSNMAAYSKYFHTAVSYLVYVLTPHIDLYLYCAHLRTVYLHHKCTHLCPLRMYMFQCANYTRASIFCLKFVTSSIQLYQYLLP